MLDKRKTKTRSMRLRALGRTLAVFGGACVLSGARIFGTYTPFGVAFAAACCRNGSGIPAAAGAFLGYFLAHRGMDSVQYSAATFILLVAAHLFSGTRQVEKRWFLPLWAAGAQLISAALFQLRSGYETSAVVLMLCEAAITFGSAYFYSFVIDDQPELPYARPAGFLLLLSGVLLTLYPVTIAELIVPARVCALIVVMAVSWALTAGCNDRAADGLRERQRILFRCLCVCGAGQRIFQPFRPRGVCVRVYACQCDRLAARHRDAELPAGAV